MKEIKEYQYGAMSSLFSVKADNKLTAYVAMVAHYNNHAHLIALYEPKDEVKNDGWLNITGQISDRLDEIFGGKGSFDAYVKEHYEEIKACLRTIKRLK